MNKIYQAIQEELCGLMGMPDNGLYWLYTDESWEANPKQCWRLVERFKDRQPILGLHERWTNTRVFPDGQLHLHGQAPIQCASVEEAKEIGITTYLLTQEGGGSTP